MGLRVWGSGYGAQGIEAQGMGSATALVAGRYHTITS